MNPTRLELRAKAAVLVDFEVGQLVADTDDVSEVLDFLDEDCDRVHTPRGERWTINDRYRTQTLHRVRLSKLRELRDRLEIDDPTPLQQALDRSLGSGWRDGDIDHLSAEQARALGVVAGWWAGKRAAVPAPAAVSAVISRLVLFADIRAMAEDHFVGRDRLLADLRDHFHHSGGRPYLLAGVGGIGKSAVLAQHVVWAIDQAGALAAVLDFDDPTLNPHYGTAELVHRIVDSVARQVGPEADHLRARTLDLITASRRRAESSQRVSGGKRHWRDEELRAVLGLIPRPTLVVLDTFEQVQRRGPAAVDTTLDLAHWLARQPDQFRVVIAGRADVADLPARRNTVRGLAPDEARELLTELAGRPLSPVLADRVIEQLGTSPLTMRLAARLLSTADGGAGDLFLLDLRGEQIDAELYRRVLAHIPDPDVVKLAHPGLILRRITPDVIRHVLAKPCGIDVRDDRAARSLFDRLARELMLVELTPDGSALLHRADIRELMLPQLLRDQPAVAVKIQQAAIHYYKGRDGREARVEELYHRLMLEQATATLAKHWDQRAAEALVTAMDELPAGSRVYLAAHLPETFLRDEDRQLLSDAQWVAQVEPQVIGLISAGRLEQALALLRERDGRSLLPALEIEVLEGQGRHQEAIEIARANRRSAADRGRSADVVTFSLHLARLLERTGTGRRGMTVLDEAITAITRPGTDRLRLLTAWLGVQRRQGEAGRRVHDRKREAIELYRSCGPAAVRQVPGLLRDLAAEVGTEEPEILTEALRTVGLDATAAGPVPVALAELDRNAAVDTGVVADLARLDTSGDEVAYDGIAALPRGETGQAVAEVISALPTDVVTGLHKAVAAEYQAEGAAALFDDPDPD